MATREQKIKFAIKRFKGFWNQFKRSKRGVVGLVVIILFSFVAIFADFIAPYDPLKPEFGKGEYPALGAASGFRIADKYCKPIWYKYLPWIPRGKTEIVENFYCIIKYYEGIGYLPFYAHEGIANATDNVLRVEHRIAVLKKIEMAEEDGVFKKLNSTQWYIEKARPREIHIVDLPKNGTKFRVTYETGVDLVENMKIVKDHKFASKESFHEEWSWTSTNSSFATVNYNSEKGYAFGINPETEDHGCIQISYNPVTTPPKEGVTVTLSRPFVYPYFEPPNDFYIHTSIWVNGESNVTLSFLFSKENETEPYYLLSVQHLPTTSWTSTSHLSYASTDTGIIKTVGASPVVDRIFASPGRYNFSVQITFPAENKSTTVYLDYVDCIIYGNTFGLLGTDNGFGTKPYVRDIFSTLIYGSRVSLFVGVLTALFSTFIGLFLGLISGYVGGIVDEGIMRFADLLLVLPTLPLFIVLVVALRASSGMVSMWNIILILTMFGWMSFARSVRSMVLSIRERAFIEAAKAAGGSKLHIINRHIIPNVFALVYITLATSVPGAIIVEASLSWLGLGDKRLASWGKMLYEFNASGVQVTKGMTEYWFWIFPPCIAIALLAAAFILVGFALDEILNPRLRERR